MHTVTLSNGRTVTLTDEELLIQADTEGPDQLAYRSVAIAAGLIQDESGGGDDERSVRARNLERVGTGLGGFVVFENLDPQAVDAQGRSIPVGDVVSTPQGFRQATAAESSAARQQPDDSISAAQAAQLGVQQQNVNLRAGELAERIAENARDHLLDLDQLELERDKLALSEREGDRDAMLAQQRIVEDREARIQRNQIEMVNLRQQASQFSESMRQRGLDRQFQAEQSQLDRALRMAQLAETARQHNATERRQIATQIAQLSRDTGDVVAAAAFQESARQQGQGSPFSTAAAQGQNFLTDESLAPLAMLLDQQAGLGQQGPFGGTARGTEFIQNQELSPETIARSNELRQQRLAGVNQQNLAFLAGGGTQSPSLGNQGLVQQGIAAENPETGMVEIQGGGSFDPSQVQLPENVGQAAGGGVFNPGVAEVHDNETVIGDFIVIPTDLVPGEAEGMKEKRGQAQTGGVFGSPSPESLQRARSLIASALQGALTRAREGGLETEGAVSPVQFSAPGTSFATQRLGAGLAAAQSGIPQQSFLEEAQGLTPLGARQGIFRRTR